MKDMMFGLDIIKKKEKLDTWFSMSEEYLRQMRELEKIEQEQRVLHSRKELELKDRYNTLDPSFNYHDYVNVINTSHDLSPPEGMTYIDYYKEVLIKAKLSAKDNRNIHMYGKHGHWHTHEDPRGCFMCNDNNFIAFLVRIIGYFAYKYPKNTF